MTADTDTAASYDAEYYASHCGSVSYERNDFWLGVFGNVADHLIRAFAPQRMFDAGCALGMLVESFWDRGVEAYGRDISDFAIASVRADMRPYCSVGSVAEPIEGTYDLLTCIEVLEHMPAEEAEQAVRAMAQAAPRILFSSSPNDFVEPTHINVRPTSYWLRLWADAGFAPSIYHDAGYLAPHAIVFERSEEGRSPRDLAAFADRIRHRVAMAAIGTRAAQLHSALATADARTAELTSTLAAKEQALNEAVAAQDAIAEQHAQAARTVRQQRQELDRIRARTAESQGRVADLEAALGQRADELAAVRADAAATLAQTRHEAAAEIDGLRHAARHSDAEVQAIRRSSSWRITAPLRKALTLLPGGLKRSARVGLRYTKSIALLRGRAQFRTDRLARQQAAQVAASPLFDAPWYLNRYPDVAIARLDPALHYSLRGEAEGREASPEFSALLYAERHPEARGSGLLLLHATRHGQHESGRHPPPPLNPISAALVAPVAARLAAQPAAIPEIDTLLHERFRELRPLPIFAAPQASKRLSIVTDSINAGSLYGGVGTAIVLAALTARRIGATLRIITRTEPPVMANVGALLAVQGIEWDGNVDFVHAPADGSILGVPAGPGDLFLTTSWWTTWATRLAVPRARIAYLLQEDERMFYPFGDDHLRCSETLRDPELLYLVNSELLLGFLGAEGLAPGGTAFEPSFPESVYYPPNPTSVHAKRRFFFYARPMNPRNLYWRGLEALSGVIEAGILDPNVWDFYFAGKSAHELRLPGGIRPHLLDTLSWSDYAAEVRQMDLGLSLMYTPHPSYPPLDLAACGAVVVTSRFGPKQSLDRYCSNIICADPDLPSLVSALGEGARLAVDHPRRAAHYASAGLQRDWSRSAAPAIERLAAWAERAGN
ncbi:MAG: methyltransferase domain-containing protein [Janthinobacterium lividum]